MSTTITSPLRPSRHIEALLALDLDETDPRVAPNFTAAPATQSPGHDWPPDRGK